MGWIAIKKKLFAVELLNFDIDGESRLWCWTVDDCSLNHHCCRANTVALGIKHVVNEFACVYLNLFTGSSFTLKGEKKKYF